MIRGASGGGSRSAAEGVKRYELDGPAPEEVLRRERDWVVRREPELLARLEVPDAERLADERPAEERLAEDEERLVRDRPELDVLPDELAAEAPFFAPCTAPRAAAAATSPAFISPASPYTAPRRSSSLARGETAAAVAAAIAPASRSM